MRSRRWVEALDRPERRRVVLLRRPGEHDQIDHARPHLHVAMRGEVGVMKYRTPITAIFDTRGGTIIGSADLNRLTRPQGGRVLTRKGASRARAARRAMERAE